MKKTLPGSSAVRKEATSALRSSAGPAVWTIGTPISAATMWASEVLPRPGRAGEQDVVERLAAAARRLDEDRQLLGDLRLVDEVGEGRRAQRAVEVLVGHVGAGVVDPDLGVDRHRLARRSRACGSGCRRCRARRSCRAPRRAGLAQGGRDQLLGVLALDPVEQLLGLQRRVAEVDQAVAGERAGVAALGRRRRRPPPRARRRPSRAARR